MWIAYVRPISGTANAEIMGGSNSSHRVLKLLDVLNGDELPDLSAKDQDGVDAIFELPNYKLGFAQSFEIGNYCVEIVLED